MFHQFAKLNEAKTTKKKPHK